MTRIANSGSIKVAHYQRMSNNTELGCEPPWETSDNPRIGKIIGWAPQVAILSHPAIGGFVLHCEWNSILETLWFGVPIATWPLYAEQQFNAFEMVKEMELAAEIMLDYQTEYTNSQIIVTFEEIERGIKQLMENDSKIRKNVKEMTEKGRKALMDGGSSHFSLGRIWDLPTFHR